MVACDGHDGQELKDAKGPVPEEPEAHIRALQTVQTRFPAHGGLLDRLFYGDDSFHDLCVDYAECVESVRRFAETGRKGEALHREYAAMKLNLECEILSYIGSSEEAVQNREEEER